MAANARVYNSHGEKYEVPRRRVDSVTELVPGDHITFHQMCCSYWHHGIVEHIHLSTGELDVIEYTNTAKQFLNDNSSSPKDKHMAKVVRSRCNFHNEDVYLMLHENCFDRATVVHRARSKLDEKQYCPFTNNCEHFAMWCKTGERSSDQVDKATGMFLKQLGKAVPCGGIVAAHFGKQKSTQIVKTGVRVVTKKMVTKTLTKVGEETMKTGIRMASKEVVSQTVSTVGKEAVKTGVRMASKEVVSQTVSTVGKEALKTGVRMASKEVVSQAASTVGKEAVKTGVRMASKEVVSQTVSTVGKEAVKTGVRMASKEVVSQTVSKVGQEAMKTGVRMASKEMVIHSTSSAGQEVVKTGIRTVTKVIEETVSTAGKEVVKTTSSVTTSTTTKEVLTQSTSRSVSNSAALGVFFGAFFEGISTLYDISCVQKDMRKGIISRKEYKKAAGKRVITGVGSFGGSSIGMVVGQVAIPVPFVGGLVGSVVGGLTGSFMANITANAALK